MVNYPLTTKDNIKSLAPYHLSAGQKSRIVSLVRQQQKRFPKISFREARTRLVTTTDGQKIVELCGTVFTGTSSVFTPKVFLQYYATIDLSGSNSIKVKTPGSDKSLGNIIGICQRAGLAL